MATSTPPVRRLVRWSTTFVVAVGIAASSTVASADPTNPGQQALDHAAAAVTDASNDVARLAADLAKANAEADAMRHKLGALRQEVNKALVDYSQAQHDADAAKKRVDDAQAALEATNKELAKQQQELATISRAAYKRGASTAIPRLAGHKQLSDFLDGASLLSAQADKQRALVDKLAQTRLEQTNHTSQLKKAQAEAAAAAEAARGAADTAQKSIDEISDKITQRQAEAAQIEADRTAAQVRLDAAKVNNNVLRDQAAEYRDFIHARAEQKAHRAAVVAVEVGRKNAEDNVARARQQQRQAEQAAQAAEAQGAADAAEKKQAATQAVRAVEVAESEADSFARKAAEARAVLKQANDAVTAAAEALELIKSLTGGAGSSDGKAHNKEATTVAAPEPVLKADKIVTEVAAKADAVSELSDIVGGAVDEPPAPEGTQAAKVQHSNRANPGQSYSLLQLYKGFDTVTPADLGLVSADSITAFNGTHNEKVEAVIARAKSVLGTPYAWGGGNAAGPTRGIRDGGVADSYGDYNKIGFDCSGLVLYAFAGVGVALPHYTGYQYQKGTKIPISQIQRGDVLFWGPNAEYHTAIYLGNGQMIEAPESGSTVKISPVRYNGMSPYAVRLV